MAESLASTATLSPVEFAGATLFVVEHDGKPFAPMKAIVEAMGLDWSSQHAKLKSNPARWGMGEIAIPSAGGIQMMVCIALYKLAGWLTSISPNKIKDLAVRERVIKYQNECDTALWDYWNTGHAFRQPALPTVITPAQCQHLRELVQLVVESGKQTYGETWTRLHRKMQVNSYLALKPEQFNAACEYLRGKFDGESIAAIAQKHFPQVAQLAAPIKEQPSMEEKQMSLDVKTLCAMITGGLIDKQSLYRIGDAAGMMMYMDACSSEKGWGDAVAAQIDGTTSAQDLQTILKAATLETWHRARGANKPMVQAPQRADYRLAA